MDRLDRTLYPEHSDRWDAALFRRVALGFLRPSDEVLDLGAGAGHGPELSLRGLCRRVVGVDPDPRVLENPFLDEAVVSSALPFADSSFDLVVSYDVCEHLEDPARVFRDVARVLRPGGRFLLKTPNRHHYVALAARLTPLWFHRWFNRLRGRPADRTFPTFYRANTASALKRLGLQAGLELASLELIEGRPEYMRVTPLTYLAGWAYERVVNSTPRLQGFRAIILASFVKLT